MTKVTDVINMVHPNYKPYLEAMMTRSGMNGESTVDEVMALEAKTRDEEMAKAALGGARSKFGASKFGPKLNQTKHCEIAGLIHMGYPAETISKAYGVDRKTVVHMYSQKSKKYPILKQEVKRMGIDKLAETYVTPEVIALVEQSISKFRDINNKYASGMAGTHLVQGTMCEFKHRVVVGWCEPSTDEVDVPGWYYKDLDGDTPNSWFHCGAESMKNSNACYAAAIIDITDPIS